MAVEVTQAVFDAIASPIRREVLWLTWNDELTVGEIAAHLQISSPTLSSHLTVLRRAGLVAMRADGNFRRYRANHGAVSSLLPLLAVEDKRWVPTVEPPERQLADARRAQLVIVGVDVAMSPARAFAAFTDASRYSKWLGASVRIDGGHFATTLEWGTEVRGHYDVIAPPHLIAMTWDFADNNIPIPGRQLVGYLRVLPRGRGARVEVHQHAADDVQAAFLETAWTTVLGRFAAANRRGKR